MTGDIVATETTPITGVTGSKVTITARNGVPVEAPAVVTTATTPTIVEEEKTEPEVATEVPVEGTIVEPGQEGTDATAAAPAVEGEATAAGEEEEVDFFEYAAEQTGGTIKEPEDVLALYEDYQNIKEELTALKQTQIEFPNEGAKKLYEYCVKFPGQEMSTARNVLHVMSLDVSKLSDKEAQFEAFAIKNKKFPRDEARKYFEAKYERAFSEELLAEDLTAQYDHKVQTEDARESLLKMQEELGAPTTPSNPAGQQQVSPEEQQQINQQIDEVMSDFAGVKYRYFPDDPNSVVSVPLEEAEMQRLDHYLRDPNSFFVDLYEECKDARGVFDFNTYALKMFELSNIDSIREQSFNSGVKYGELKKIMEIKNTSKAKPQETSAPSTKPQTYKDAMRDAVKALNAGRKSA